MNISQVSSYRVSNTSLKRGDTTGKKETLFAETLSNRMDTYGTKKKELSKEQKEYLQKKYNIKDGDMYFGSEKTKALLKELEDMGIISKKDVQDFGYPIFGFSPEEEKKLKDCIETGKPYFHFKKLEGYDLLAYESGRNRNLYEGMLGMAMVQKYHADVNTKSLETKRQLYERSAMYKRIACALKEAFDI